MIAPALLVALQVTTQLTCSDVKRVYQQSAIVNGGSGCCSDPGAHIDLPDCSAKTFDYDALGSKIEAHIRSLVDVGADAPEYFDPSRSVGTKQNMSSLIHQNGFPKRYRLPWMAAGIQCADEEPRMWAYGSYKNSSGHTLSATVDTPFNMASINEILMHTALFQLWKLDKIQMDDPVTEYIPMLQNVTAAKVIRSGSDIIADLLAHPDRYGTIEGPFTHRVCLGEALITVNDEAAEMFKDVCKDTTYYLETTRIPTIRDVMSFSGGMTGMWRPLYEPGLVTQAYDPTAEWSSSLVHVSIRLEKTGLVTPFPMTLDERTRANIGLSADDTTIYLSHVPGRVWSYNEMYVIASILVHAYDGDKTYGLASVMRGLVLDPLGMTDTHYGVMDMAAEDVAAYNGKIPIPVTLNPASPVGYVDGTPSFTTSQIAPNGFEAIFFEAATKTTMRDLLKLGNMFANDGWVYGQGTRYMTMADVVYGMARKALRLHPVEDLVGDYFKTTDETGYFGDLDVDTNFFGLAAPRERWDGHEPFGERSGTGTRSSEIMTPTDYISGWYGIYGQSLAWERQLSKCTAVSTTGVSYNAYVQKEVRDKTIKIFQDNVGAPRY